MDVGENIFLALSYFGLADFEKIYGLRGLVAVGFLGYIRAFRASTERFLIKSVELIASRYFPMEGFKAKTILFITALTVLRCGS